MMILSYCYIGDFEGFTKAELRRKQSETANELLEKMLHVYNVEKYTVARDQNGRPFLQSHPNIDFNISHSNNIVVCAVSDREGRVGLDVEKSNIYGDRNRELRMAERYFSADEAKALKNGYASFADIWTQKEAYLKYVGIGMGTRLKAVNTAQPKEGLRIETFKIDDYTVSVCLDDKVSIEMISCRRTEEE